MTCGNRPRARWTLVTGRNRPRARRARGRYRRKRPPSETVAGDAAPVSLAGGFQPASRAQSAPHRRPPSQPASLACGRFPATPSLRFMSQPVSLAGSFQPQPHTAVPPASLVRPVCSTTKWKSLLISDMRKPPASETGAVDARDMRKQTCAVDARDRRKPPASETAVVDARDMGKPRERDWRGGLS